MWNASAAHNNGEDDDADDVFCLMKTTRAFELNLYVWNDILVCTSLITRLHIHWLNRLNWKQFSQHHYAPTTNGLIRTSRREKNWIFVSSSQFDSIPSISLEYESKLIEMLPRFGDAIDTTTTILLRVKFEIRRQKTDIALPMEYDIVLHLSTEIQYTKYLWLAGKLERENGIVGACISRMGSQYVVHVVGWKT